MGRELEERGGGGGVDKQVVGAGARGLVAKEGIRNVRYSCGSGGGLKRGRAS